MNVKDS